MNEAEVKKIVDEEIARIVTEPSKIKYRSSSIFSTIKNYGKRMQKLQNSLEDAKKDLKEFHYGRGEVNRDGSFLGGYADVRANRAVNRVARLEAEIIQLTEGIKPENYINNRAIKLKDTMMKNFVKNSYNGYTYLSAKGYDEMFNEKAEEETEDVSYEEEKEKFENKVSEFENNVQDEIEEKIAAANAEVEDEVDVNEVDAEETQETVDETFDEKAREEAISEAFDDEEVEEEETPITPIINIQPREMSKVTPATVAVGINDDVFGTEERDVPVVVEEREEVDYKKIALMDFIRLAELDAHIKAERDPKIVDNLKARFEKYSMELSDVQTKLSPEELSEVLQALPEEVQNEIVVISSDETEKEEVAEEVQEETPVEVEKEEIEAVKEPEVVTKENNVRTTTAESIHVLKLLKQQNELLEEKEAKVLEEQEQLTARYEEAKRQLLEKKKSLEAAANERDEQIKKIEKQNAQTKAELDAIFAAVEGSFDTNTNEKKK